MANGWTAALSSSAAVAARGQVGVLRRAELVWVVAVGLDECPTGAQQPVGGGPADRAGSTDDQRAGHRGNVPRSRAGG
jgi:hypothetical protein